MALDIGIGGDSSLIPLKGEPSLSMEDAAPYWFLHPLFEKLAAETGQYIDLYGDASFAGAQLVALKKMLGEAKRMAEAQPDRWEVSIGVQLAPVHRELWESLDKVTLLDLIAAWERVVARAEELGRPVVCGGD
jgi:hypothetical protein